MCRTVPEPNKVMASCTPSQSPRAQHLRSTPASFSEREPETLHTERRVALPKCTFPLSPVQNKTRSHPHGPLAPSPLSSTLNNVENLWRERYPPLYPAVRVRKASATSSKEENPPIKEPAFLCVPGKPVLDSERGQSFICSPYCRTCLLTAIHLPGSSSLVNHNLSYVTQYS